MVYDLHFFAGASVENIARVVLFFLRAGSYLPLLWLQGPVSFCSAPHFPRVDQFDSESHAKSFQSTQAVDAFLSEKTIVIPRCRPRTCGRVLLQGGIDAIPFLLIPKGSQLVAHWLARGAGRTESWEIPV